MDRPGVVGNTSSEGPRDTEDPLWWAVKKTAQDVAEAVQRKSRLDQVIEASNATVANVEDLRKTVRHIDERHFALVTDFQKLFVDHARLQEEVRSQAAKIAELQRKVK